MREAGSSLARMLALLDAFTPEKFEWDVDALSTRFGYTPSSTYRYVKELCKAGLLVRLPRGIYVVGARVIELESLIRDTDPVTRAGLPLLQALARDTGCHVLLSNVYGNHLINVVHVPGLEPLELTYLRGRGLPWFKGAPSRSVLAFWPRARVRQLFEDVLGNEATDERWAATWAELRSVRKLGYCISRAELDEHVVGFGAPVMLESEVIGSLSLVCSITRAALLNPPAIGATLQECAQALAQSVLPSSASSTPSTSSIPEPSLNKP